MDYIWEPYRNIIAISCDHLRHTSKWIIFGNPIGLQLRYRVMMQSSTTMLLNTNNRKILMNCRCMEYGGRIKQYDSCDRRESLYNPFMPLMVCFAPHRTHRPDHPPLYNFVYLFINSNELNENYLYNTYHIRYQFKF